MNVDTMHAHIDTASADCDGPMYREYVVWVNEEEIARSTAADGVNDFTEIEFRNRVLTSQVSVYSVEHSCHVSIGESGFEWREQTDEGYRSGNVRWCDEADCDPNTYAQRDVYAEMMGY